MMPAQVFKTLLTMPIQKLEKISRIEAETDIEPDDLKGEEKKEKDQETEEKIQTSEPR